FLLQRRLRRDVGNHRRLNEVALTIVGAGVARAASDQASFFFADLDIAEDVVHRTFVDDRRHVRVHRGIANGDALGAGFQFLEKLVVDALVDDGARAGRALLALEAERGRGYAFYGGVDIGIGVDDDGVFTAHFEHRALDPELALLLLRSRLVDVQSDFARAGERDEANSRMGYQSVAKACTSTWAEVHHALGHAAFFEQ